MIKPDVPLGVFSRRKSRRRYQDKNIGGLSVNCQIEFFDVFKWRCHRVYSHPNDKIIAVWFLGRETNNKE